MERTKTLLDRGAERKKGFRYALIGSCWHGKPVGRLWGSIRPHPQDQCADQGVCGTWSRNLGAIHFVNFHNSQAGIQLGDETPEMSILQLIMTGKKDVASQVVPW